MKKYLNRSGNSGVTYYEIGKDYIKVLFIDMDKTYLYNYIKPGKVHVEKMKKLAVKGLGLSTYISRYVKENYYR